MIIDGFIIFRLKDYISGLEDVLDYSVKEYVVEKEYNEFIHLLKIYVDSKPSSTSLIHLIYTSSESILLDKDKNIVNLNDNIFNATYLSDINFSSNDYALNTLLTILPKRIQIHLCVDFEDEFINTLKLIFRNRINICKGCNLCRTYKMLNNINTKD